MAEEGVHRFNLAVPISLWRKFAKVADKVTKEPGTKQHSMTECAVEALDEWTHTRGA